MNEILTISEMSKQIQAKIISPVELTNKLLERIKRYDPIINSFISVDEEFAASQAKIAEREIMNGHYIGAMHGIPISIKDNVAYSNLNTTNGSNQSSEEKLTRNARVTQRLVQSGSIIIGKNHLNEFAFRGPHPNYGWTRNPWNIHKVTGGSSTGSGASVQARFTMASIGTDTGGSVRNPASHCGVVGLKPTYGMISREGVTPLAWTLDHVGSLTRTCEDAAILLQTMAESDSGEFNRASSSGFDLSQFQKEISLKGLKIGIPSSYFFDELEEDVLHAIEHAISIFKKLGASTIPIDIEYAKEAVTATRIIIHSEAYSIHQANLESNSESYGILSRLGFEIGQYYPAHIYIQAQRLRTVMQDKMQQVFKNVDIILTPTLPQTAIDIEENMISKAYVGAAKNALANFVGCPAISIPCGFNSDGLPIGLHFMSAPYTEAQLLSIASTYEQCMDWYKEMPNEMIWNEDLLDKKVESNYGA